MNVKEHYEQQAKEIWGIIEAHKPDPRFKDDRTMAQKATWFAAYTSAERYCEQNDHEDWAYFLMSDWKAVKIETVEDLVQWAVDLSGYEGEYEIGEEGDVEEEELDDFVLAAKEMWK